jgi:hypothetical protein
MNFAKMTRSVSTNLAALALAAVTLPNLAKAASDPAYNPATTVTVSGIIASVRDVPAGQPLEGVHVMLKSKTSNVEVYLGPASFLKFLRTGYAVGEEIDIMGSRVKAGSADVVLAREVNDGITTIELRDVFGAEAWKNWGVEAAPANR